MPFDLVTRVELDAALAFVLAAPKTDARIDSLCFRPGRGERRFPATVTLTRDKGIPGERWLTEPWMRLPDGSPHPGIQVSILPRRVADLAWRNRTSTLHPGDTIIADLDCTVANLPIGSLIQAGSAVLQVSDVPNYACAKWKVRYGDASYDWIREPDHAALRLRGILCSIAQDGEVILTDRLHVLSRS
jgi:hypothetical protein